MPPAADPEHRAVAIVTGAGSGVGRAIARRLGARSWRVALVGRSRKTLRETGALLPGQADDAWAVIPADVADPAQVERMVDTTLARFGRLDALVNNAGFAPCKHIDEHDPELVRRTFDVNALGPVLAIARALPIMLAQGSGVIVNTSSLAAHDPFPGLGVYGAAKASAETICKAVANEYGTRNIRAFAVAPGAIETGMLRSLFAEHALPRSQTLDPDEVARTIVACVTGDTDAENGSTILLPSP